MEIKIKQFRYRADNLGYLIYGNRSAAAIDGGAVNEILSFLKDMDLELIFVTNTHSHFDHTACNRPLLDRSDASFLESIKLIMGFPEDTIIYAGHDYVEKHMETARRLEPDNKEIDIYLKNYDPDHVCATLKEEMKVNPSLRFNDNKMISILRARGLAVDTEYDRWIAILGETLL